MPREKDLEVGILLDFYGELLSPEKSDVIRLYFDEDLSLSEIAENTGITRQGVRDRIEKAKLQLYTYEEKLGLAAKFREIDSKLADAAARLKLLATDSDEKHKNELLAIMEEIKTITI